MGKMEYWKENYWEFENDGEHNKKNIWKNHYGKDDLDQENCE